MSDPVRIRVARADRRVEPHEIARTEECGVAGEGEDAADRAGAEGQRGWVGILPGAVVDLGGVGD